MNVFAKRTIRNHSGFALIAFLLVLVTGGSFVLLRGLNAAATQSERDKQTMRALAEAKAALIGYALTYAEQRPGQPQGFLPCPDRDGDGRALPPAPEQPCGGVARQSAIGWLPWRQLGLPPLRDGDGECLWYAVSGSYKNNFKTSLTSDTDGQFILQDGSGNITIGATVEKQAIAIIFAPGAVLGAKDRSATGALTECGSATLGDPINQSSNYLDTLAGINNATGSPPLPTAATSMFVLSPRQVALNFNDMLLAVTPQDFAAVYKRMDHWVANRVQQCLTAPYPWAAALEALPVTEPPDFGQDANQRFGRIPADNTWGPDTAKPAFTCFQDIWATSPPPGPKWSWWWWDTWREMVFYAVDADAASPPGDGTFALQLTGATPPNSKFVIAVAGRKLVGQKRSDAAQKGDIANYLEDHNDPNLDATIPLPGPAGNIPTGDEQFVTTPTVVGTAFNDVVCNNAGCP